MVIILLDVVRTVLVNEVGLGLHRLFGIEVGGQRLVLDVDQLQRALGDFLADRRDASHVVADVANLFHRQRRLIVTNRQNAVLVRRICAGDNGDHAFQRLRARGINALDACMRIGRVQNLAHQHAGQAEVVSVLAGAGGFAGGVDHRDGFADNGKVRHKKISN